MNTGARTGGRRRRKPRPAPPTRSWTLRYALAAYITTAVLLVVLVMVVPRKGLRIGAGGIALDLAMLGCLVPLYRRRPFRARDLGLRPAAPAKSVVLVTSAALAVGLVNFAWLQGVLEHRSPGLLGITLHDSTPAKVLTGFALAVSAPITEEIFFRGLLYRALRNHLRIAPAALVDGLLFGLIHGITYPLDTLPPRMVFGVLTCLLYESTGSLLPGIALHCLIDAAGFEAAISGHTRVVTSTFLLLGVALLVFAATRHVWREVSLRLELRRLDRDERRRPRDGDSAGPELEPRGVPARPLSQ